MKITVDFPAGSLLLSLTGLLLAIYPALSWETYHDPNQNDAGYCATCHPGFGGGRSDTLHALHTGGDDPITSNCDLCHTGSGRGNPLIMWSTGDNDDGLGCTGCHGRDYGETIEADYEGFSITGLQKNSGIGLRRHHATNNVLICLGCHSDDPEPYPENVMNPGLGNTLHYYFRPDVSLGGQSADTCANEDSANDADSTGLDNDGDNLYDAEDPDCNPDPLLLSIETLPSGSLQISWPAPTPGFVLQENLDLNTANWADLFTPTQSPTQRVNGFWQFLLSPAEPATFYRLQKP